MKPFFLPSLPHFFLARSPSKYPASQLLPHTSIQSIHYSIIRPTAQLDQLDRMKTIPSRISRRKAYAHVKPIIICTDETATPIPVTPTKPVKPVTGVEVIDLTNLPFPGVKKNRPKDINRTLRRILFRHRRTTSTNDSSSDYQTDAVKHDLSSPSGYHSDTNETDASSPSDDTDPTETGLSSPDDDLTNTNNAVLSLRKSNTLPAPALPTPQAVVSANNIGLLNDPIYSNCPIDLSQVYMDQNGNEQSHQFLLPMPMKFTGLSSYRSSEMNYLRRWRYGLTRPTAVERFAAMARHQQPVRLIKTQAEITIGQYHELADQFINSLVEQLEALEEQHEEIEVEFNVSRCPPFLPSLSIPFLDGSKSGHSSKHEQRSH